MITESKFIKKLPAQMDLTQESLDFAENAENTGKGMNGAIISNFLINLVFQGSLQNIWGMISCLQINFHLIGINSKLPAKVWVLYGSLIQIT